jgi:hypothetical protein
MTTNLSLKLNEAFAQAEKPGRDYVSAGFTYRDFAEAFPHRVAGDKQNHPWVFLRREVDHGWYVDDRNPLMGFLSVDEASVLHSLALALPDSEALEIGCHRGWSTAHLAAGVKQLDVVDPVLSDPAHLADVEESLTRAGVRDRCALYGAQSPAKVLELLKERGRPWSFIFVDGDHEPDGPLWDAQTVANCASRDALIVFHDLASPVVAEGLAYLRSAGWSCLVFQTMQIMGVAWRGNVKIPVHIPDPKVNWTLPDHLRTFMVSGETPATYARRIQKFFMDYSSHDPYARARAPLPLGLPTQNALPTDVKKLQEDLRAARAEVAAFARNHALDELTTVLKSERAKSEELKTHLDAERARSNELNARTSSEKALLEELKNQLDTERARLMELQANASSERTALHELRSQLETERLRFEALGNQTSAERQAMTRDFQARYDQISAALAETDRALKKALNESAENAQIHEKLETLMKSRRFLTRKLAARVLNR